MKLFTDGITGGTTPELAVPSLPNPDIYRHGLTGLQMLYRFNSVTVSGQEHLSEGKKFLVPTHSGYGDIAGLVLAMPDENVIFAASHGLFRVPGLGYLLKNCGAVKINRDDPNPQIFNQSIDILERKEYNVLAMFGEGKRYQDDSRKKNKPGIGIVSILSRTQITPVAILGPEKHPWLPGPMNQHIEIGVPFDPEPTDIEYRPDLDLSYKGETVLSLIRAIRKTCENSQEAMQETYNIARANQRNL